jgi:hypothetical protein
MPFSGPSSYLSTVDEFIAHWTDVNAALAPDLVLPGGTTLANMQTKRATLAADITALEGAINVAENLRTSRDNQKTAMAGFLKAFNLFVRGNLANSNYVGELHPQPDFGAQFGHWNVAMDDAANTWTTINASPPPGFTPPLILPSGTTLATFTAAVAALKTTFTNWTNAEQAVGRELEERDATYNDIRDNLALYRPAVLGSFIEDHPLVLSLPRLVPLPGHTPDPVVLSGEWNDGTSKADLSWTESTDVDLQSYQVRRSGATPYNTNTELAVATLPPGTLTFSTDAGLTVGGSTMGFKVYVKLTTGNEKGSNAVTITNPNDAPP